MKKYKLEDMNKWIEALESGKYEQLRHTLKGEKEDGSVGFCCLGVFCEIKGRVVRTETLTKGDFGDPYYAYVGDGSHYDFTENNMPNSIKEIGIEMNDNGESFKVIAQMIKSYIEDNPEEFE